MDTFDILVSKIKNNKTGYSKEDLQLLNFLKNINQQNNNKDELKSPTPLRVSTQSAKCSLTYKLDMSKVVPVIKDIIDNKLSDTLVGLEYKDIGVGEIKRKKKVSVSEKKKFYNQVTVIGKPKKDGKNINVKFFLNGSISMTGCKDENDGIMTIVNIINELKKHPEALCDKNELNVKDYSITMINTDYEIGFKIDRDKLYNLLIDNYKVYSSYDPSIYQGVKVSYMWNKNNDKKDGVCKCEKICRLEKNMRKKNICKIVTIAIFQSGKVIITGASNIKQTREAYDFINKILYDNYSIIVRMSILDYQSD